MQPIVNLKPEIENRKSKIQNRFWLVASLVVLTLLSLAFTGGEGDTDAAHCRWPCVPVTPTFTPTPFPTYTPTPGIQACQVTEVIFDKQSYEVGEPMHIRLRVEDAGGQPLTGANVGATVTRQVIAAQAVTPLEILDDMAGYYDGVYGQTDQPGDYTFTFSVSDVSGPDFLPCSAQQTVRVNAPTPTATLTPTPTLTATVTPTVTVTPTDTPTPTITPTPSVVPVTINPPSQTIDLCGTPPDISSIIAVENVTNLRGVQLAVSYDPSFIQVIDAFRRPRPPVQVAYNSAFNPVSVNLVNTRQGEILFAAASSTSLNGHTDLIFIDWRLQGRIGQTSIIVTPVLTDASGKPIEAAPAQGTLTILINSVCTQGMVNLQGRTDHSGITISNAAGEQTSSYPNGLFALNNGVGLTFAFPGYLSAQLESAAAMASPITLLAGDTNNDKVINIFDLAYLAQYYLSTNSTADLNGDGVVNILDLTMVAGNYGKHN